MTTPLNPLQNQSIWNGERPVVTSFGLASAGNQNRSDSENSVKQATDVLIVGGGLAGLSAAYHLLLAKPGSRVVVYESQTIGFGASTRNSGMLTPGIGQSLDALVRKFGPQQARAMYLTSLAAVEYLEQLSDRERMDFHLRRTGQLIIARGRGGRRRLAKQASLMNRLNLPCNVLDDAALATHVRVNVETRGSGPAALQLPIAGVLNPARLVNCLAMAVQTLGGRIVEHTRIKEITPSGVLLDDGQAVQADNVVLATNAYDLSLSLQRGRLLPMHLRMIGTRPLTASELNDLGWHQREGIIDSRRVFNYFRLTDDNRLLMGGGVPRYRWQGNVTNFAASAPDVSSLRQDLRQAFPQLSDLEIERTWTGVIAYSMDTLPVVGKLAGFPKVVHVGGWCGHGIALSVYAGRWVSELIFGTSFDEPWFRGHAPRVPTEIARWCGVKLGALSMQMLDRFV